MSCKITLSICFEDPFWVAVLEREDESGYQMARHVFGPEPSDPELGLFVLRDLGRLRFSPLVPATAPAMAASGAGALEKGLSGDKPSIKRPNPKRVRREIEKALAGNASKGTKAQQALSQQREALAQEHKERSRQQREAQKEAAFQLRRQKQKEKHRGH